MVAAFPIAKLTALVIRQISKPLANAMKERAKNSYVFRTYVCMPPAQFYHWCEVKSRMYMMGMGKTDNITKLNEAMAIDLGANMLGEGVIFTIAAVLIVLEYMRSSKKEEMREQLQQQRLQLLESQVHELCYTVEQQDTRLRHHRRLLLHVQGALSSPLAAVLSSSSAPAVPLEQEEEDEEVTAPPSGGHSEQQQLQQQQQKEQQQPQQQEVQQQQQQQQQKELQQLGTTGTTTTSSGSVLSRALDEASARAIGS